MRYSRVVTVLAVMAALACSATQAAGTTLRQGIWQGQSSGNRVAIENRADGVFVTPLTQNPGQTVTGFLYRTNADGAYHFKFPDGNDSLMKILGADQVRVTNPDGWTDVFKPVG